MSSCDAHLAKSQPAGWTARRGSRATFVIGVASLLAIAPLLSGCGDGGFRPMYASIGNDESLVDKLASVDVAPIGGKTGQRIRNELVFQNTGGGVAKEPLYRLSIIVTESVGATLVKTTGDAASSVYSLDAKFTLIDIKSKKVLLEGESHARASFDRFRSIYSNVRASDDAANRASKTMADELKIRIAAFLSNTRSPS